MLGLFAASHIPYNIEKKSDSDKPSLEEMLGKALDVLEKDKKGFFLFVEGMELVFFALLAFAFGDTEFLNDWMRCHKTCHHFK